MIPKSVWSFAYFLRIRKERERKMGLNTENRASISSETSNKLGVISGTLKEMDGSNTSTVLFYPFL